MARLARGSALWLWTPFVGALAAAAFGYFLHPAGWGVAGALALVLAFFLVFFRDPERAPGVGVVSPADGKVVRLDQVDDSDLGRCDRLSVFMSPADVHVNRFPFEGTVRSVRHRPGGHIPAFDKDADRNERVETLLDTPLGPLKTIQIAGTVARRIVPYVEAGHAAQKGERMGLIRLGSRCDLLAPVGRLAFTVQVGDRVRAGSSTVAEAAA